MKHLDLFSGIGGFALAVERVWPEVEHEFCDIDPFCRAILKKHWPNATIHEDIKKLRGGGSGPVDIVTGGFPCQPFSAAGKRRGKEDDRHLWPEMLRVIREAAPRWVIGENVGGLLTWNGGMVLDEVFADLEAEGYEVWAFAIPACAVGAPHRRDRVWIVAHAISDGANRGNARKYAGSRKEERLSERNKVEQFGQPGEVRNATDTESEQTYPTKQKGLHSKLGFQSRGSREVAANNDSRWQRSKRVGQRGQRDRVRGHERSDWDQNWPEVAAILCTLDDGLPNGLARPRGWRNAALKGSGNAIVPQVAEQIMRNIKAVDI